MVELSPTEQPTDEQLAGKVQEGDTQAFNILLGRYRQKLLRYGNKFLLQPGDIEDVTQDIFLKAYQNIKSFDVSRKFSPWIYRIAHNEFINLGKKRKGEPLDFFDFDTFFPHPQSPDTSEKDLDEKHTRAVLGQFLDRLSAKYREPLVLYYIEGLDYRDIAEVLRIPVGAVGVRLNRAKKKLKDISGRFNNPLK
jgi:RNA polymerase sigma-70 factor (ECF subfamily)